MPAPQGQMQLVMRSNACDRGATSAYWLEVMMLFRNWSLQDSIHFKPRPPRNAARLIDIAPEWYWVKAPPFWPWKISSSLETVARLCWQKSSATGFPRITFTSHSRILPVLDHDRPWSERFRAPIYHRTKWTTLTRTEPPRYSMTQLKGKRSVRCSMGCP